MNIALLNSKSPCPFLSCSLESPLYGWIEITYKCNLNCPYCYADSTISKNTSLSLNKVMELLNDFVKLGSRVVMISGGEPTTHPNIVEILEYCRKLGINPILVTNGSLITKRIAQVLKENAISVQLSVDSVNRETYIRSRGADLLPMVLKNIDLLLGEGVEVQIACTLTKLSRIGIKDLVNYAISKNIQNVHIGELIPEGRSKQYPEIAVKSIFPIYKELYELQKKNYMFVSIDTVEYYLLPLIYKEKRYFHCNAMRARAIEVSAEGNVYFCGGIRTHNSPKFNICKQRLSEIYPQLMKLAKNRVGVAKIKECQNCEYAYICAGGCRAIAFHSSNGNINAKSPYCKDIKKFIDLLKEDISSGRLNDYITFIESTSGGKRNLNTKFF